MGTNEQVPERMELTSSLSELARAWEWVEGIADRHGLHPDTRFAIHLCIEEAFANTVIHGYRNQAGYPVRLTATVLKGQLTFTMEDQAPPFIPALEPEATGPDAVPDLESIVPGGNGIRLMRQFAAKVIYEPLEVGNRLTLSFPCVGPRLA